MITKFLFALVAFMSFTAHAHNGLYVGNGGEGIEIDGKVYLRDLHENGTHLSPVMGSSVDPVILQRLTKSSVAKTGVDLELLAAKLNDLDTMVRQVKFYMVNAMDFYAWELVPQSMLSDEDSKYFAIATRFQRTIRINKPAFAKMPPDQQVALIVHEIFSALLIPLCDDSGLCFQPDEEVREVVNMAFGENRNKELLRRLSILFPSDNSKPRPREPAINFYFGQTMKRMLDLKDETRQTEALAKICGAVGKDPGYAGVMISFFRDPYKTRTHTYWTEKHGQRYEQIHLKAYFAVDNALRNFKAKEWLRYSPESCASDIGEFGQKWFSYSF